MKANLQLRHLEGRRQAKGRQIDRLPLVEEQVASSTVSSERAWLTVALGLLVLVLGLYWVNDNRATRWVGAEMPAERSTPEVTYQRTFRIFTLSDQDVPAAPVSDPELWPLEADGTELALAQEANSRSTLVTVKAISLGDLHGRLGMQGRVSLVQGEVQRYLVISLERRVRR